MLNTAGVEGRRAADDAVDLVIFLQEELGEIGTILAGDTCGQRDVENHADPSRDYGEGNAFQKYNSTSAMAPHHVDPPTSVCAFV
ncbi:hypothetical protein BC936DRAFT_149370 [Jimgerdemannia flammicorona]|uniref:Uncharacterized protein n=2 Tax=Jimgerdemannia flammicorona TaxID=994334 RepID=A0A433DK27_9FUNG|nr:hypothetical protein BC936DRAFT_149370 [Jimgerdemannia flammicorona]RUS30881.1 hypothetical protein BC938DRAFT_478825 [Jimgerdemannia flammicorona]